MTRNTGVMYRQGGARHNKRERVRMKAKEYGRKLMARDHHITEMPALARVCRAVYDHDGTVKRTVWYTRRQISKAFGTLRNDIKHRTVHHIERAWVVKNIWVHLEYAQAERDALNYFYARYLMVRGTDGAKYL